MKRTIFILAFLMTLASVSAQEIGSVFLSMPDNIIFGLEAAQKDMLIANAEDTAQITVEKGEFGRIKRLAISQDYISIQTSEIGTTQIKLLPLINDSKIVCVVKTVCGKACDSQIQFYTTKWIPITQTDLFPGKERNWFINTDADRSSQDFKNAYAALDMDPMKITLSPNDTSLEVTYDVKGYLSEDDYQKIQPFLIEGNKVLKWDRISYK